MLQVVRDLAKTRSDERGITVALSESDVAIDRDPASCNSYFTATGPATYILLSGKSTRVNNWRIGELENYHSPLFYFP